MDELRGIWRGKRIDNGEWVRGGPLQHCDGDWQLISGKVGAMVIQTVVADTLGECTGFLDKNYNIAFEGDIIKFTYGSETVIGVVKYDKYIAAFILNDGVHSYLFGGDVFSGDCEIIGNIHDNLEMIGGDSG